MTLAKLPLLLTPLTYIPVGKGAKFAKKNLCGLGVLARENDLFHVSSVLDLVSLDHIPLIFMINPSTQTETRGGITEKRGNCAGRDRSRRIA